MVNFTKFLQRLWITQCCLGNSMQKQFEMWVDTVAVLSTRYIRCNQCMLSINNSKACHNTYLTRNGHGKCRSMFLDETSCLLEKCNWPKLFYFLQCQNNFFLFANYGCLFCKSFEYFHVANYSFCFISQITVGLFFLVVFLEKQIEWSS